MGRDEGGDEASGTAAAHLPHCIECDTRHASLEWLLHVREKARHPLRRKPKATPVAQGADDGAEHVQVHVLGLAGAAGVRRTRVLARPAEAPPGGKGGSGVGRMQSKHQVKGRERGAGNAKLCHTAAEWAATLPPAAFPARCGASPDCRARVACRLAPHPNCG